MTTIVLMTDFGIKDEYVGVIKGVIYGICPDCNIIDLTHRIEPQNIKEASITLAENYKYFPQGSIFLCVVDPGVGTARKSIIIKGNNYIFIAPNNGLLTYASEALDNYELFEIIPSILPNNKISNTFHGRDLFAPATALIASGNNPDHIAIVIEKSKMIKLKPLPKAKSDGLILGEIYKFDHFGNAITDIKVQELDEIQHVVIGGEIIKTKAPSYGFAKNNQVFIYIGSNGFVELGIPNGNFKEKSKLNCGTVVKVLLENQFS